MKTLSRQFSERFPNEIEINNVKNDIDAKIEYDRFFIPREEYSSFLVEVTREEFIEHLLTLKDAIIENEELYGNTEKLNRYNKMLEIAGYKEELTRDNKVETKTRRKISLDERIDNIYNQANIIENVTDSQIFGLISKEYRCIGRSTRIKVYAYVCNRLFGDNAEEIIKEML